MNVRVLLFAAARQLAGCEQLDVALPASATLRDLRAAVAEQSPSLQPLLPHARFAVNRQYANDDRVLQAEDEIALIPPVSGG